MNKKRLSYTYSFKCTNELKHFDKLSVGVQANIEQYIVKVICESFVDPADEDYITARLLAQKGMHRAFFWAASQALEKYLKAFLLLRGVAVNEKRFKGHPISALYSEACLVDDELAAVEAKYHSEITIHPDVAELFLDVLATDFINDIATQGCPDSRYNPFGISFNSGYLFALDSFIFGLRQKIGVPPIQETLKKVDQGLVEAFYLYNPWFALAPLELAEIPNKNFSLMLSDSVTTLDMLVGAHAPYGSGFALQWLDKKMKLPWKVKEHLIGIRKSGVNDVVY
jgi:hypothetical protein